MAVEMTEPCNKLHRSCKFAITVKTRQFHDASPPIELRALGAELNPLLELYPKVGLGVLRLLQICKHRRNTANLLIASPNGFTSAPRSWSWYLSFTFALAWARHASHPKRRTHTSHGLRKFAQAAKHRDFGIFGPTRRTPRF
jgi:hypothetical protein